MIRLLFILSIFGFFGCGTTGIITVGDSNSGSQAKPTAFEHTNKTYQEYIKTVKFNVRGFPLTQPIMELGSRSELELSFDDLNGDIQDYYYTVIHCNSDWEQSELNTFDYIDGFAEERISDYNYSFNTVQPYTHYRIKLPDFNLKLTKSGNYILLVYDRSVEYPIITRQFYIVDPQATIRATADRSRVMGNYETHQQLQFIVNHEGLEVINPMQEIKVNIIQNEREDNMITALRPQFAKQEELQYRYQTKMSFEGMREFRDFDIRSLRYLGEHVKHIDAKPTRYDVLLHTDKSRAFQSYYYERDYNGKYIVETQEGSNDNLEADYANVKFRLSMPTPFSNGDVHLLGELANWTLDETSKLKYNYENKSYEKELYLKQGFYDYAYAFKDKATQLAETDRFEGSSYQTENVYTIFVYFKPFGRRYDQLIAVQRVSTVLN